MRGSFTGFHVDSTDRTWMKATTGLFPTTPRLAGVILVHQPDGADACRWEIEVLALTPQADDNVARDLLGAVEDEARRSGRKTLVSTVMDGSEQHFLTAGFARTIVLEYKLDENSVTQDACIMYKIKSSEDWANVVLD
ncbi:hypothetical protein RJ55_06744 [Drechmeria coniospora]|nr:hypothetical protein RJ55_06744 [Drechmeria coniospora]